MKDMTPICEKLELAVRYHRAGEIQRAERLYGEIIRLDAGHADALHLLGVASHQRCRYDAAAEYIRRAIAIDDTKAVYHSNLGAAYRALGRLDDAIASYREAIRIKPDFADAHCNLGNSLSERQRTSEAIASYRQAAQLKPHDATVLYRLGTQLLEQGKFDEAVAALQQSISNDADFAEAHSRLADALSDQGRYLEAVACYRKALTLRPDWAETYNNLGTAYKALGKLDLAVECYRRALSRKPGLAEAHNNLGNALKDAKQIEEAINCYRQAIVLRSEFAEAHANLAALMQQQGEIQGAVRHLQEAIRSKPTNLRRIQLATLLPPIYESREDLDRWRRRLQTGVHSLIEANVTIDPALVLAIPNFYLAYQGRNDRQLQTEIARLHRSSHEYKHRPAHGSGKIRVGFISRYLCDHTIGRLMRGAIAHLSRDVFEVTVLAAARHDDGISRFLRERADCYIELVDGLPAAIRTIDDLSLDILFYTDIGMDPVTFSLAHSRLAPIQCVTWGHPLTTGSPTIDYFISSSLLEADDADEHYSETLIRLESLGVYYYRPSAVATDRKGTIRAEFGLPADRHLYGCLQSLFKLHPEFDAVLGDILRKDRLGEVVLLSGSSPDWDRLLMRRFESTIPDVAERIRFVPRQDYEGFLRLNTAVDVLLDPIHYSGGNTSFEAFSLGIPVVTLPSRYLRGRITHGLYRQMNLSDCVAGNPQEYAEIAVRLGTDPDYRHSLQRRIHEDSDCLFESRSAVQELERFFREAHAHRMS